MKKSLIRIVALSVMMCSSVMADAQTTHEIDGRVYTVTSLMPREVELTRDNTSVKDDTIPSIVDIGRYHYAVTSIGTEAFYYGDHTNIYFGDNIRHLAPRAMQSVHIISKVYLNEGLECIDDSAFCYANVYDVQFSSTVKRIGYYGFYYSSLTGVDLCNVDTVLAYSFCSCKYLRKVTVSESVKFLDPTAFYYNENLKTVHINSPVLLEKGDLYEHGNYSRLGYCFNCATDITIGENVKKLGDYCFYKETKLRTITLPEGLEHIGKRAFAGTDIVNFVIPSTVTSFGEDILCESLKYCELQSPSLDFVNKDVLRSVSPECRFLVNNPKQVSALNELGFANVYLLGGSGTKEDVNGDGEVNSLDVLKVYKYMQSH